ncbi:uncharacterized protein LOC8287714 [Ricinus communis]|uniref:Uncharacterized protein n=1 Tax=Ricinus communis TaxID=3988 RepID=B9RCL9_RICCO|nr:uncharacterized protein LOC8287714 [Ricinus communis]EEF51290.1 conserved hypothetical protein [Ricinus communis]|eukprot:XP_002509903.1 uncharacterized protein LOC8287714 [Ricinus communis]
MRCKKHPSDLTSTVGVCASCLSERLLSLMAAQAQADAQLARANSRSAIIDSRNSDAQPPPPPLIFPRSVSPYVAPRHKSHHLRFYSTPQVGPTFNNNNDNNNFVSFKKKKHARFSLLSNLFRSRSEKFNPDPDPCANSYSTSPSWFSTVFSSTRSTKKQSAAEYSGAVPVPCRGRRKTMIDRGMSPDTEEDCDRSPPSGSGSSSESTSSHWWKRTPVAAVRRAKTGHVSSSSSGLAFCLSPLVRASPNRHWNQKGGGGLAADIRFSGEVRVPAKPHLSTAASFCANRSRKLCDLGRIKHNC